jgi:hypothetical protein
MDLLPEDILRTLFALQTDARSIASLTQASRSLRAARRASELLRPVALPRITPWQALMPENVTAVAAVLSAAGDGVTLCKCCWRCSAIVPITLEAVIFAHRCPARHHRHAQAFARSPVVLYRGCAERLTAQGHPSCVLCAHECVLRQPSTIG